MTQASYILLWCDAFSMSVTQHWPLAFISIHVAFVMKYAYDEWDKSKNGFLSIRITLSNVPSACL